MLSGPEETSVLVSQPAVLVIVTLEIEWSLPVSGTHWFVCFTPTAVPPLATNTVSPSLALLASNLSMPTSDLPPGASPRKKPRKQQHVISTEEGDMMETNSTDDEKSTAKSLLVKTEKRKSPPKEYIGKTTGANVSQFLPSQVHLRASVSLHLTYWNWTLELCKIYNVPFNVLLFSHVTRWRRSEIRPSATKTSHHFASSLSEPLESCLPPLSEVQWRPGQRLVSSEISSTHEMA